MGNCFILSNQKQGKVLRVVKTDGKVIEFREATLVKDILVNFSGSGIGLSQQALEHLSPNYELKLGKIYYMIPLLGSAGNDARSAEISSMAVAEKESISTRRIKIIITKQQLQELLNKQISVKEVLSASGLENKSCISVDSSRNIWKPKLESIPEVEGSE